MHRFGTSDIKYLKGVGSARALALAEEFGIRNFRDLLYYFPFRYNDRSRFYKISELEGEMPAVQIRGRFVRFSTEGEGARQRLVGLFSDGRGLMEVLWFARRRQIREGLSLDREYVIFGKPQFFRGSYSMVHPEIEVFNPEKPPEGLRGQYTLSEGARKKGFTSKAISKLIENALTLPAFEGIQDTLPATVVKAKRLMPLAQALKAIHFPSDPAELRRARERFKFEELFYVELHILRFSRERGAAIRGPVFSSVGEKFNRFYSDVLPFPLTGAQKRVIKEIRADMRTGRQMNRLVQGDVGCGKTLVAFMTMLIAADNGFQSALMAPTEILARQHFAGLKDWGDAVGVRVEVLTGSSKASERREIDAGLADGSISILVGTHALLEERVKFKNLGLAVIDEQHRFGVAQRARLWEKSVVSPHVLVMTATPIPRTLAMTVYGDLDVSVIDELPPGRKPVTTLLRYDDARSDVSRIVNAELKAGRQIYIVYPLVHESDKLDLKSVEEGYERICAAYPSYRVCLVHGQLSPDEKARQMGLFVRGEARIMVATTVIEVGVNVPNATVMVIENAERFGLSQLHQLRGRVGRGADRSYCVLMSHYKTAAPTRKRLEIMTETSDGFVLAEADMKMRGPGDMEGTQQSGIAFNLRIANLATDGQIIEAAREEAGKMLDAMPELSGVKPAVEPVVSSADSEILKGELALRFGRSVDWSHIS